MDLDDGAVQRDRFNLDAYEVGVLHFFKNVLQNAPFRPATQPRVDRMPISEALWQAAPFAAVLGNVQHSVEDLEIGDIHISALTR